jgi:uncharacterized damage-inducible protein DinB
VITPAYVQTMSRYNAWQNKSLQGIVQKMSQAELDKDRGAFFGSLQRTLSHLLWGDTIWISRFDGKSGLPEGSIQKHADMWPTKVVWASERAQCDVRIRQWADIVTQVDLDADLAWRYSDTGEHVTRPFGFCVTHFFNHQTHHRGQVHAMLTAAGQDAPVSDLSYLPEDV